MCDTELSRNADIAEKVRALADTLTKYNLKLGYVEVTRPATPTLRVSTLDGDVSVGPPRPRLDYGAYQQLQGTGLQAR